MDFCRLPAYLALALPEKLSPLPREQRGNSLGTKYECFADSPEFAKHNPTTGEEPTYAAVTSESH